MKKEEDLFRITNFDVHTRYKANVCCSIKVNVILLQQDRGATFGFENYRLPDGGTEVKTHIVARVYKDYTINSWVPSEESTIRWGTHGVEGLLTDADGKKYAHPQGPDFSIDMYPFGAPINCPKGEYRVGSSCTKAAKGHFVPATGQIAELKCATGTYSDSLGAAECTKCQPGYAQPNEQSESCELCPPGKFAAEEGATQCSDCLFGTYSDVSGLNQCSPCGVGTYQDERGKLECKTCIDSTDATTAFKTTKRIGTTTAGDCVCQSLYFQSKAGRCELCGDGLDCPIGADVTTIGIRI